MRKRIWSILLTVCLLLGLLPTTALAGGDVAMFTIRHDPTAAADAICTAAGQEILLPGTHVVSAPATGWVEIGDDDGNYEVQTTFQKFIADSTDWSISWSVNIGGTSTEVTSGQVTSITVDCPALEEGQTAYSVYVNATLTATYRGKEYTVWGSTSLYIRDPIWTLPEEDQQPVYTADRNGAETYHVPLNLPDTLIKYTSDNPRGEEMPVPSDFQFSCESNPACYIATPEDGSPYLFNPDPGRYRVTVTIEDQDGALIATQFQTYYVTDGEVLARSRLTENPNVIWTLTKDGTLTFSGDGAVTTTYTPWSTFVTNYRAERDSSYKITKVVAEEGITSLGTYLLSIWNSDETLELVSLPSTLTELKSDVFKGYQITSATYAGENWSAVTVGDGNDNLNRLLAEKGITLWVENNRLYGRFTDPGTGDRYNLYRLYFYNSAQASNPDAYISVGLKESDTAIDLTGLTGHGTLDHFAVYANGTSPYNGDDALYDVEMAKPIRFVQDAFDFPFTNVTASITESGDTYYPYRVCFSNLTQDYIYELYNPETQYSWKFEDDSVPTNDKVFGDCTLTAILASEQADAFLILNSEAYSLSISEDAQPDLPQQEVSWTVPDITWTYGGVNSAQNTAYNSTEDGGALTYSSSDPGVAVVDEDGKATIVGAGTTTITATAAAVPGKYAETSASYTLTINKTPLTITANNAAITYGEAPANAGWAGSGYAYEEDASVVTGTPVYTYTYEQYQKAGTYEIQVSGLSAKNYDITYAPGTLTVEKAADYTITLDKLEQMVGHVSAVTAQISPWDDSAVMSVEYKVGDEWGSTLPGEVGTYEVRASLTSSDNITPKTEDIYTTGTLTIRSGSTVSVGGTTVPVETSISEGKAEITVSDEALEEILNSASGEVSMDLSGVKDTDELVLPGNLISGLSQSETATSLTVATEDASVTLSAPVLDTVADAVTSDSDQISVKLAAVEEKDLSPAQQNALNSISQEAVIVEVSLVITHEDQSTTELHQLGGNVEVKVPHAGAVPEGKYVVVCYLSDDGNVTYLRATYDETTRQISFTTNHFSHYALFISGDPWVQVNGGSGSGTYAVDDTVTITADSKSGYRFDHWEIVSGNVSLENANSAETTFTMPTENVELTAVYTPVSTSSGGGGGGAASYSVSTSSTTNGTISVSPKSAAKDATVTITVKPNDGYVLDTLTVKDANGKTVDVTKKSETEYTFVMPASKVTISAAFLEETAGPTSPFTDVATSAYYYDAVLWAVENGVTNGTSATTFSPDMAVSRAQMVTFLWRAAGSPKATGTNPFADVKTSDYYYDAVLWAVENGITVGTSATTFSPDAPVTRAQAVTFQWRADGSPVVSGSSFDDVAADTYYADAVTWAVANGITNGTGGSNFSPDAVVSRAQAVTFLWRELA